jgi:release factor glutamine methyltransferase
LLIGYALGLDRVQLIAQDRRRLETQDLAAIDALLARRIRREPVARIIGMKEFWSLPLAVARGNAERLGLSARCDFIVCNIAEGVSGRFDLIVSNPPYIAHGEIATLEPEVRDYDPALALDGGIDGLDFYRAIAAQSQRLLAPGGRLIVELGAGQEAAVRSLFAASGLGVNLARADLAGIPRALGASFGAETSHEGGALRPV